MLITPLDYRSLSSEEQPGRGGQRFCPPPCIQLGSPPGRVLGVQPLARWGAEPVQSKKKPISTQFPPVAGASELCTSQEPSSRSSCPRPSPSPAAPPKKKPRRREHEGKGGRRARSSAGCGLAAWVLFFFFCMLEQGACNEEGRQRRVGRGVWWEDPSPPCHRPPGGTRSPAGAACWVRGTVIFFFRVLDA